MENKEHYPASQAGDTTLVRITGAVMCVASVPYIIFGLPLSLVLIGLPLLAMGIAMIYFGLKVYGLKKDSYVGALVVLAVNVLFAPRFGWLPLLALLGMYVIYTNREKFDK